jgi:altronate dehydratase small subunit
MMAKFRAIVMKAKDNVATVVEAIDPNTGVDFEVSEKTISIRVGEAIPFGHKVAIREICQGDPIIKYGEAIGLATQNIKVGQHVHVHNLESCRGRGDK